MGIVIRKPLIQEIQDDSFKNKKLQLFVLRLDLLHKYISGNKWYKLKYNLEEAQRRGKRTLLTFGGAYSNHIIATAAAAKEFGFSSIGIIRGDELKEPNERLKFAQEMGMKLLYVSRELYRDKEKLMKYVNEIVNTNETYILPEGGSNDLAVKGCREILNNINIPYDIVCCACGTGTTLAGITLSLKPDRAVIGFSSLKGGAFLEKDVQNYVGTEMHNWSIETNYHFGGYAKSTSELIAFIKEFNDNHSIELDYVYTGKMMYGIFDLASKNRFIPGSRILAIHTGGIFRE